ncbi:MAG TPA: hypothetical protein V6D48_04640 [Oculatellaceae cyanobacterium]
MFSINVSSATKQDSATKRIATGEKAIAHIIQSGIDGNALAKRCVSASLLLCNFCQLLERCKDRAIAYGS